MKKLIEKLFNKLPIIGFNPGDHVVLIDDPKQRVYVIEKLDVDNNGIPNISRGPMRQLPPSISYLVRDKKWGGLTYFRADSITLKSMTPVAKKIANIEQQIKEAEERVIDFNWKANEEKGKIEILKRELEVWQKESANYA